MESDAKQLIPATLRIDFDTQPIIPITTIRKAKTLIIACKMNNSASETTIVEAASSTSDIPTLDPVTVMAALGSEVRWPIVQLLADGQARNISEIRAVAGTTAENISKQLRVLLVAGILENRPGEDRRQSVFTIPAAYRTKPGVLDFGFCVIDLKKM